MSVIARLQLRRGTTAQNQSYTGAIGEITYDTQKKTVRVHDGSTQGGIEIVSGWGSIDGNIDDQTDLKQQLDTKIDLDDIGWIDAGDITETVISDYTSGMLDSLISAVDSRISEVRNLMASIKSDIDSGVDLDQIYVPISEWESEKAEISSMFDVMRNGIVVTVRSGNGTITIERYTGYTDTLSLSSGDEFRLCIGDIIKSSNVTLSNITVTTVTGGREVTAIGSDPSVAIS